VDSLGKDTVKCVVSIEEPAGAEVGAPGNPDTDEIEPKKLPEDTGLLPVDAVDGRFGPLIEGISESKFNVLPDKTGGAFDAVTEAVIGALGCAFGGTNEDAPGVDADEAITGLPGEPELCSVFVVALEA
jgi:hypothetical protein